MTKNNQRYKQKDAQPLGGNITDTELGQELGSIHQAISQLSQNFSQLQNSQQGAQTGQASNPLMQRDANV